MLLKKWQFRNQVSNNNDQTDFYIESNYYWNDNWNIDELKYLIPFEKHPLPVAQVSQISSLTHNQHGATLNRVEKIIQWSSLYDLIFNIILP